ncbi:hypothetical protein MTW84_00580 [Mammaliicoccus sciuri]|uniref:hypothetical protein n=1 Tax=Mammaliicoccus sciuri TaxID=1296 RepID=UPI001FB2F69F|nr:hypothetical protein [Mammaliicoccus sciuri]MCJ0907688.1 hypothetical protein [Mammaliicoccus sciuri]
MRRLATIEQINILYAPYFVITLFFADDLFSNEQSELYKSLLKVIPSQIGWCIFALIITVMYVLSMFIKHHGISMFVNGLSGIFFTLISVTYLFTYPNIGLAIFALVGLKSFQQVFKISNQHEQEKTEKYKIEINAKGAIHEYDKEEVK